MGVKFTRLAGNGVSFESESESKSLNPAFCCSPRTLANLQSRETSTVQVIDKSSFLSRYDFHVSALSKKVIKVSSSKV